MVDIKVGDWVKDTHWSNYYEVVNVSPKTFTVKNGDYTYSYEFEDRNLTKRKETILSPVREVTTKEIVDGVYGRVMIEEIQGEPTFKLVNRFGESDPLANFQVLNAKELRELAKTLNEVAEFLEGE